MRFSRTALGGTVCPRAGIGWLIAALLALGQAAGTAAAWRGDSAPSGALATLLSAKPGSEADQQLAAAWQELSGADYRALPAVFAALDQASPLAANWISTALDQIVDAQSAAGGAVPVDVLEQTALDTSHSLLTRKTAIDLLERVDAHRFEQLQSRFLDDPQSELRRPAIELAISGAKQLAADQAPAEQQRSAWRRLLNAARDPDQVTAIVKELKSLDDEVDVAAHFGYLLDWHVIGPFDNTGGRGLDTPYPPEALTLADFSGPGDPRSGPSVPGKSGPVSWKRVTARPGNGDVDLNQEIDKLRDVCAYGVTLFESDRQQQVEVRLRVQNSFKIWLNNQLLLSQPVGHTGNSFDQYKVQATLRRGTNLFLIKSCQVNIRGTTDFYDTWHFCVRVCDSTGGAILSTDRRLTKTEVK